MLASGYQEDDGSATTAFGSKPGATATFREARAMCWKEAGTTIPAAILSSFQNRYLAANIIYFIYATLILYIDLVLWPNCWTDDDLANLNRVYLGAGCLHLVNALLYVWSWLPLGFGVFSAVMIPEYLNILSACLYIWTATLYPQEAAGTLVTIANDDYYGYYYLYDDPTTFSVHRGETAAATVEMLAAFGWVVTWWLTYPRYPGRGWTLDDPDAWANMLIVAPSLMYFAYNVVILQHPEQYGTNDLYVKADIAYWVGSVMYLIAALRDDGWCFWYPTGGQCNYGMDSAVPLDPLGTNGLYEGQPHSHDSGARTTGKGKDLEAGGAYNAKPGAAPVTLGGAVGQVGVAILSAAGWLMAGLRSAAYAPVALVRRLTGGSRPERQGLVGGGN